VALSSLLSCLCSCGRFRFFRRCWRSVVVTESSGLDSGRFAGYPVCLKHPAIGRVIVVGRPVYRTYAFASGAWQGGVLAGQFQPRPMQAAQGSIVVPASYLAAKLAGVAWGWQTRWRCGFCWAGCLLSCLGFSGLAGFVHFSHCFRWVSLVNYGHRQVWCSPRIGANQAFGSVVVWPWLCWLA